MRLLFVIDPPQALNPNKDSTIALMRAAAARGDEVFCAQTHELFLADGAMYAHATRLEVRNDDGNWMTACEQEARPAAFFDAILMRKEPPVDDQFVMATRLLDIAARDTRVINAPYALRDLNEKLAILRFPELILPTWVGADANVAATFRQAHNGCVVIKPLNGMGGQGVYVSQADDKNFRSVFDLLSDGGQQQIMAQRYSPAARAGDFRVFAVAGGYLPWMLARLPRDDDHRGNMAAGGMAQARPLDAACQRVAAAVAPKIAEMGVAFAGLDVIGGHLIEINITCPTGLREVTDQTGENVAEMVLKAMTG